MTTTHLTPAELDALLEAVTWREESPTVDGAYWWRADANDHEPDIHLVVAGYFYEAGMMKRERVENFGGEWLGPVNPATITRLVLMVRELQEHYKLCNQVQKRGEHSSLTCARVVAVEEVIQRDSIEHFRARAVRAIQQLYEVPTPHNIDISLGYAEGLERATKLVESLPLVETEGR